MISKIVFCFLAFTLLYSGHVDAIKKAPLNGTTLYEPFTVFYENGDVDLSKIPALIAYHKKIGAKNLWLFSQTGEVYSLTRPERECILTRFIDELDKANYSVNLYVGAGFLPIEESCKFAKFIDCFKANIVIVYNPPTDYLGGQTSEQVESDVAYIAECAPNSPIVLYWPEKFLQVDRDPNIGITVKLCAQNISNFGGFIGDAEDSSQVVAYIPYKSITIIVEGTKSVNTANQNNYDGHTSLYASVFPAMIRAIDNAPSKFAAVEAQLKYSRKVRQLCDLRSDCRRDCPLNIVKQAFEIVSNIDMGHLRRPLCDILESDKPAVQEILNEKENINEYLPTNN